MKTQLPSKYPWKSSREPLGGREPQVENHCFRWNYRQIHGRRLPTYSCA